MRGAFQRFLQIMLIVFPLASALLSQGTTGIISGTIRDQTGAVMPGASIQITNQETGRIRTAATDSGGRYRVPALELGILDVQASAAGFRTAVKPGVMLTVGSEVIVDLAMEVGQVAENVTVTGEVPLVQSTSAELSGLVGDKEIRDLPLNGRSYEHLALLQPGVVLFANHSATLTFRVQHSAGSTLSVDGTSPYFNTYVLDGSQLYDHTSGALGSVAGDNLGVDAILEFRVLTHNYSAEYGRTAGGVISAVTRSGSNQLHGSVFEFLRNNDLDARQFFDQGGTQPFRRNQFGGVLGGPIVKDRTFFFVNYEGLRSALTQTNLATVPNGAAHQGILPGPSGPVNIGIAPAIVPYMNYYPLPNGQDFGDGTAQLFWTFNQPTTEDFGFLRLDHQFSDHTFLAARLTVDNAAGTAVNGSDAPGFFTIGQSRQVLSLLELKSILSPRMLNVARFAFNRTHPSLNWGTTVTNYLDLAFNHGQPWAIRFNSGGGSSTGVLSNISSGNQVPLNYPMNVFQYMDALDYQKGRHSLRMGFDLERIQINATINGAVGGAYQFTGLQAFMQGLPRQFNSQTLDSISNFGTRQWLTGMYLQDDFKMSEKLTLNLGLRYEFVSVPDEVNGRRARIVNLLTDSKPTPGPVFDNPSLKNLGPRFGFAWSPLGGGKSVIRGGVGAYYNEIMGRYYYQFAMPGFQQSAVFNNPPFVAPVPPSELINVPSGSTAYSTYVQHPSTPTVYHYNLTVEQQLPSNLVVSVGYVGSLQVHLFRLADGNPRPPNFLPNGTPFFNPQATLTNPQLGEVSLAGTDAMGNYNSLQVQITKRVSHGLRFQASYSWSRALAEDTVYDPALTSNTSNFSMIAFNRSADRGLANYNQNQVFSLNYSYQFPGDSLRGASGVVAKGWEMQGIFNATSGLPFTIGLASNQSADGQTSNIADRPNLRPGHSNNPVLGNVNRWYDPNAFIVGPADFYGNLGRNTVIGPGQATFDFSLVKIFHIKERNTVTFRAEFFNALNLANFGLPNRIPFVTNGAIAGNAGAIQSLNTSSRQIQFGLRYSF